MILKIGGLVCGLILLGLGVTFVKPQQENWREKNSIQSVARRTKAEGKGRVTVPGPDVDYAGANMGIDEALKDYSAVVAEPVESKSYLIDSDNVRTAYKFRIVETLSQKNAIYCHTCSEELAVPKGMQINPNEFVLDVAGGSINVDGVEITMTNSAMPSFENGKKYLLFVSFTPGASARLAAGPSGVFKVNDDDSLEGVSKTKRRMNTDIESRFAKSFSRLKSHTHR